MKITEIHPFDLGAKLQETVMKATTKQLQNGSCDILLQDAGKDAIYKGEQLIVWRGKFYRQTINAPIRSRYGKKLAKQLKDGSCKLK